ncbi:ribokinase [Marispirochaeta sp.]|uniref:ribokinase n=1 Tax=Marispirochaeta sp. TaxID=2038653 RepID=UPI0029C67CC1|nr:ribokinase [Marispirochaeta sp.]
MIPRFCSIGSINMDLVVHVGRFPEPGETLTGSVFNTFPGGKGANQAVALAKLGADIHLVGKVGDDAFGRQESAYLASIGVDISLVETVPACSTGVAIIEVDGTGENHIVIVPGANDRMDTNYIEQYLRKNMEGNLYLLQLEIPLDTVLYTLKVLKKRGKRVILDPAPMPSVDEFEKLLAYTDIVTPNETEIQLFTGIEITGLETAEKAGRVLLEHGGSVVIIKAGGKGAYIVSNEGVQHVPAFPVKVTDTTGAGDSFNAGLAYALGQGWSMNEAVRFASAVGGLACTAYGAQSSMPSLSAVKKLIG